MSRPLRVAADRAQQEEDGGAADEPGAYVKSRYAQERAPGQRREVGAAEGPEHTPRERREDAGVQADHADHRESHQRRDWRVIHSERRERGEEDEHAGDRRQSRFEHDRGQDQGGVTDADAPQRCDPRRRDPDRSRDVLGEDRRHLRLQRQEVRDAEPPGAEDALPGDREEQVVGGEDGERDAEVDRVGVPQSRPCLLPGVPERIAECAEQHRDRCELQPDDDPPPPPERSERLAGPHPRSSTLVG